jgi:hypothetical protein
MTLYPQTASTTVLWPEPMESIWQGLAGGGPTPLAPKLPHLSLADVLFIGAVMALPRQHRPWGAVTWIADVFRLSRVSVYALHDRLQAHLLATTPAVALLPAPPAQARKHTVAVTKKRLARTALAATFPGNVAIRPLQTILQEAFDQRRSIGWISQLRLHAGRLAGEQLRQIDTSPLGPLLVLRDETFFQGQPILLVVDPVSTTILFAQVCADRQADTWGIALLMAQERGAVIAGLIEDMARVYPKSQQLVGMAQVAVQKDPWHLQRDGSRVRLFLEKAAYRAMGQVIKLEKQLATAWDEVLFTQHYLPAVAQEDQAIADHDAFAVWLAHLGDAFELVDWRAGEIREPATATWLLDETLTALGRIAQPRVQRFVKTLRQHQAQLLTFLTWLAAALPDWRQAVAAHLPDLAAQKRFERTVARHWRLRQAVINGQHQWRPHAAQAQADLNTLTAADATCERLAARLLQILDGTPRTSSLIECINGLLKSFLNNRQCFQDQATLQAYLDLFVLWHNMRPYQRGKRQGQSPYQIAGIDPGCADWLELLGYPAN